MMPMNTWHFSRYGVTADKKGIGDYFTYEIEWEDLMLYSENIPNVNSASAPDYDSDSHDDLTRMITAISFIVLNKDEKEALKEDFEHIRQTEFHLDSTRKAALERIQKYMLEDIKDDDYFRNNCYKFNYRSDFDFIYNPDEHKYNFEEETTKTYTFDIWNSIPGNAKPFCVYEKYTRILSVLESDIEVDVYNVCQSPAFFMQLLASYSAEKIGTLAFLFDKYDTALRYESAKHYLLSCGVPSALHFGGITHPHYLQSYIVLAKHITADDFE